MVGENVEEQFPSSVTLFTMHWNITAPSSPASRYAPLLDTIRLYAGWLLAWYAIVFLVGGQQKLGRLATDIEWLESLSQSPLVLRCAFGTFLFLLLSTIYTWKGGTMMAVSLTVVWIAVITGFVWMT